MNPLRLIALLALILYFTSGCAGAPTQEAEPQPVGTIGVAPEPASQISPAAVVYTVAPDPLDAAFAAADAAPPAEDFFAGYDEAIAAAIAAAEAGPHYDNNGVLMATPEMPQDCEDAKPHEKRRCWHLYTLDTAENYIDLGAPCEFSFQCETGLHSRTCQYGVISGKEWQKACTVKMPGEQ